MTSDHVRDSVGANSAERPSLPNTKLSSASRRRLSVNASQMSKNRCSNKRRLNLCLTQPWLILLSKSPRTKQLRIIIHTDD